MVFGSGGAPATILIRGVRVNASMLGFAGPASSVHVYAAVVAAPDQFIVQRGFRVLAVGNVVDAFSGNGLSVIPSAAPASETAAPAGFGPAFPLTAASDARAFRLPAPAADAQLSFLLSEGFPGALATAAEETARSGGEVTNGARIDIVLLNVPANISFQAPQLVSNSSLTLTLVVDGRPLPGATVGATTRVDPLAGFAVITYEATTAAAGRSTPGAIRLPIGVTITPPAQPGTIAASIRLAPVSTVTVASDRAPIPRFADTSIFTPVNALLLSQSDFVFTTVEDSAAPLRQELRVLGFGAGAMNWRAQSSVTAGSNWLNLENTSGSTALDPSTTAGVGLTVNPAGLAAGNYHGLLSVSAARAANSPQVAAVHVRVLPRNSPPAPEISPGGLVFEVAEGGANPAAQNLAVRNSGGGSLTFTATVSTSSGGTWLGVAPNSGTPPATLAVQVNSAGLRAGVYRGAISLAFSGGTRQEAAVLLLVTAAASVAAFGAEAAPLAGCPPAELHAINMALANQFSVPTSWPVPLVVRVADNCGTPIINATVVARFSGTNPEVPVLLTSLRDGTYFGRWLPGSAGALVVTFTRFQPGILGHHAATDRPDQPARGRRRCDPPPGNRELRRLREACAGGAGQHHFALRPEPGGPGAARVISAAAHPCRSPGKNRRPGGAALLCGTGAGQCASTPGIVRRECGVGGGDGGWPGQPAGSHRAQRHPAGNLRLRAGKRPARRGPGCAGPGD